MEVHLLLFKGRDFSHSFLAEQNSTAGGTRSFILLKGSRFSLLFLKLKFLFRFYVEILLLILV
ncbi:unnamed protein product [Musa textilis]